MAYSTQRNYLLKLIAENDKQFKDILGVQSRTFYQDCPEMKQKIAQVEKQELEEKLARSPNRGEKRAFDPFTPERLKLPAIKKVMKIRTGRRRSGPSDERIPI